MESMLGPKSTQDQRPGSQFCAINKPGNIKKICLVFWFERSESWTSENKKAIILQILYPDYCYI